MKALPTKFVLGSLLLTSIASAEARGQCGGRSYGPHCGRYDYHRRHRSNSFDLVSDMFSIPFYTTNSLFRQQRDQLARLEQNLAPRYSISESEDGKLVELIMEVPGVPASDLHVEIENTNVLRVRGSRTIRENGAMSKSEFDQSFQLNDDIDVENISVTLASGILSVVAPKVPKRRSIRLKIEELPLATKETLDIHRKETSSEEDRQTTSAPTSKSGVTGDSENVEDFVITDD